MTDNVVAFPNRAVIEPELCMTLTIGDDLLLTTGDEKLTVIADLATIDACLAECLSVVDTLEAMRGQYRAENNMPPLEDDSCTCPSCLQEPVQSPRRALPDNDNNPL